MTRYRITQIEDYKPLIGRENVERIREKARKFKGLRVANFNSTYYGGGVAETLSSLTLLMNNLGLRTEWRVIQGTADFFSITKKMHNALQGGKIDLSSIKKEIFEQVIYENSVRNFLEHDFVIVHDPQPLPLIEHYENKCRWIWRCGIDLSRPQPQMWKYLRRWIDKYDAAIVSCPWWSYSRTGSCAKKLEADVARLCARNSCLRVTSSSTSISSARSAKTFGCKNKGASATDFWPSRSRHRRRALLSRLPAGI